MQLRLPLDIAFRPGATPGFGEPPFGFMISDIQINLSTTTATPDGLSFVFSENVGADDTVVYRGPLAISSANTGPPDGPKDFDIIVNLQTAFTYIAGRNLLLDVRIFQGGPPTFRAAFDAAFETDSVSRAYSAPGPPSAPGSVDSLTANVRDTLGLVVQFSDPELFATFAAQGKVTVDPSANDDAFEVNATFTLGAASDGLNPSTEAMTLKVGTLTVTIPAGSFTEVKKGVFKFAWTINNVALQVDIQPKGKGFKFNAVGTGAKLAGHMHEAKR